MFRTPSGVARSGVRRTAYGTFCSAGLHVGLLAALACWTLTVDADVPLDTASLKWGEPESLETELLALPDMTNGDPEPEGGDSGGVILPVMAEAAPVVIPDVGGPLTAAAATSTTEAPHAGSGGGEGDTTGDGTGGPGQFFDLDAGGDRIVYVVDCSKSMKRRVGRDAPSRFDRVRKELISSVRRLQAGQQFFVIFFNTEAWPMPARAMVDAGREASLQSPLEWIARFQAGGETDPEPALLAALSLKPDAIFFLTDGVFKPAVVARVKKANSRNVPIHCIGFGGDVHNHGGNGERLLLGLSKVTGGTYAYIAE